MDRLLELTYRAERTHFWFRGFRRFVTPWLSDAAGGRRDLRLLDCGCGTGANLALLARHGRAFGFDLTARGLDFAKSNGVERVARASIGAIPFPDASFDIVTSFDVLYGLPDEVERAAGREMARVLKPGGTVLVTSAAFDMLRGGHGTFSNEVRRYTTSSLSAFFTRAGLEVSRVSRTRTRRCSRCLRRARLGALARRGRGRGQRGRPRGAGGPGQRRAVGGAGDRGGSAAAREPALRQHGHGAGPEAPMTGDPATTRVGGAVAGAAVAASVWISAGTLAVVNATTLARVAALPDATWLAVAIVAGAVVGALVRPRRSILAPLALLALLWLPWLPVRVPATFLMWEGPLEGLVWAAVVAAVAWRVAGTRAAAAFAPWSAPPRAPVVAGVARRRGLRQCVDDRAATRARGRRAALPRHHAEPAPRRRSRHREQPPAGSVPRVLRRRLEARLHAARRRRADLLDSRPGGLGAGVAGLRRGRVPRRRRDRDRRGRRRPVGGVDRGVLAHGVDRRGVGGVARAARGGAGRAAWLHHLPGRGRGGGGDGRCARPGGPRPLAGRGAPARWDGRRSAARWPCCRGCTRASRSWPAGWAWRSRSGSAGAQAALGRSPRSSCRRCWQRRPGSRTSGASTARRTPRRPMGRAPRAGWASSRRASSAC